MPRCLPLNSILFNFYLVCVCVPLRGQSQGLSSLSTLFEAGSMVIPGLPAPRLAEISTLVQQPALPGCWGSKLGFSKVLCECFTLWVISPTQLKSLDGHSQHTVFRGLR